MHRRNPNQIRAAVALSVIVVVGGVALYAYEHGATQQGPAVSQPHPPSPSPSLSPLPTLAPTIPGSLTAEAPNPKCHMHGLLPDPICTPGAIDPTVTEANMYTTTICIPHYSDKVRPPVSYTNKLKAQQMQDYGFSGQARDYEEDHLISLELGGSPIDPHNLWPEPGNTPNPKDNVENFLHQAVCDRRIGLHEAQVRIATDWTTAENGIPPRQHKSLAPA